MASILVTGGAGYIGSHICKALAKEGFLPVTYDNLTLGHSWAVKWGPLIQGDIRDRKTLEETFQAHPFQGVIHLAALSNVRESEKAPEKYYENNVVGSQTLLEMVSKYQIPSFVFSSTCAVYGKPKEVPIREDHPCQPINVYGKTKLAIETLLKNLSLPVAILRYFNAAGADLEGELGECHEPETHLIPRLIQSATGKVKDFTLYGIDHETPDKTPIRDYIHVSDLADAHVKALKALLRDQTTLTLNLGTGRGHSVLEVIDALESQWMCKVPVQVGPRNPGDPPILFAASDQAQTALGWEPKHSDLPTILESAWRWLKR